MRRGGYKRKREGRSSEVLHLRKGVLENVLAILKGKKRFRVVFQWKLEVLAILKGGQKVSTL